jgi:clan AA aspartic protease (TIGR02281 family)
LAQLGTGRAPDLTKLSSDDLQSIELACIIAKNHGPADYHACLNNQLAALGQAKSLPQPGSGAQSPPASVSIPRPKVADGREIVVSGSWDKGCYVEARSNGQVFRMLLDTGASGALTFGRNHAEQLGLDPSKLNFDHGYRSANGEGHYASVRLREFQLDTFIMRNVEADITEAPQSVPLLGVGLLHRLHLHLKDGNCILTVGHSPVTANGHHMM